MMNKKFWVSLGMVLVLGTAYTIISKQKTAQANASGYEIGTTVADFKLKNVNGGTTSLADFKDAKGVIVVFTSNHCPFAKAYEDRMVALDKKYAALGYPMLAINSNDAASYEEDSYDNMKAKAKDKGYTFAYVADPTQAVARAFGAAKTPQVFLLKNENGKFAVQYIGAIDDSVQDASVVSKRYVEDAIGNLMANKPVVTTAIKAIGCSIKFKEGE